MQKPNILVVISDTLRAASLGCYGNASIHTPHIDTFAQSAVQFTRAYPESLPTIPVRRALHTGRRAFPFRDYRPVKWDIVYLPGWQAIANEEDTLAENLAATGYQTGFVTDTLPYFAPGFNFQRGFWQWEYIRGQQQDRWRSPYALSRDRLVRYGNPDALMERPHDLVPMHLANTNHVRTEEDTSTARTFRWAIDFLQDNLRGQPFYLLVDCFAPHEPWEAPEPYYRLYGDPNYTGNRIVHCRYGPAQEFGYTPAEIAYVKAQYSGLVTLVDTWFGHLMAKLEALGLAENTAVFFLSDHGTNFCDNAQSVIGKPADAMYPGVMCLPLLVRLPNRNGASTTCTELTYNLDVTATIYDLAEAYSQDGIHGQSLLSLLANKNDWHKRDYVTCRYAHSLCYIDDRLWLLANTDGQLEQAFDLDADPHCMHDIRQSLNPALWKRAWDRLLEDAAGNFPDYQQKKFTDAIGQRS